MLRPSRPALFTVAFCVLVCAWAAFVFAAGSGDGEADAEVRSEVGRAVLASINKDRLRRGAEPLRFDARLVAACQTAADRVTERGAGSVDLPNYLNTQVEERGYRVGSLQMGFGQMAGEPAQVVAAWRAGAAQTFEALSSPDLRDFGFGVGFEYGVPSYVLAGGVSMGDALAEAARGLNDLGAVRRQVLESVNQVRRRQGLDEYWRSKDLDEVAQGYAEDMWRRGYYGHDSPEGENVRDRVREARVIVQRVGENVASGQPSATEVMEGWLNSPPHRANILNRRFTAMGVGVAAGFRDDGQFEIRWVQVFAQIPR